MSERKRRAGSTITLSVSMSPKDVAVVGFDDVPQSARTEPPLTTVRQPIYRLGATTVDSLLDLIEYPDSSPRRIVLPTELVVRTSCGSALR